MYRKLNLLLLFVALCSFSALQAATITFTGGGDGTTWEDPANWDTGTVPGFGDRAVIEGTSTVTLSSYRSINSLRVRMDAELTITPTGTLVVNELDPPGSAVIIRGMANVINNGSLVVLNSPQNGIELFNGGDLYNYGFVNVVNSNLENIFMYNNANIYNHNVMFIQGGGDDALDMEDNAEYFNYGTLNIDDYDTEGIDMDDNANFINDGTLNITNGDDNDAIDMDDDDTYFENNGMLNISVVINRGEGIEVDDGLFYNSGTGTVNISGVTGDGVYIQSDGEVINDGTMSVSINSGDTSDNAVELECSGFLENNNILNIWNNGSTDAIELECSTSELVNETCGVINILTNSKIDIQSTGNFDNLGVLATIFTGTNTNFGTLSNDGKIIDPDGFMVSPNAVVGAGTITTQGVIPATSDCDLNIGSIGCGGTTVYDAGADEYTQTSTNCVYGPNYMSDQLSYAFRTMCGNGEIIAHLASFSGQGWAGIAMRESTAAGSKKVQLMLSPPLALARREVRVSTNGTAFPQQFPAYNSTWLRIQRVGYSFRMFVSQNGYAWQFIGMTNVLMSDCIEVGLVSTNYNYVGSSSTAVFDNVFITAAAPLAAEEEIGDDLHVEFENATDNESISVYPNPTNGKINIEVMSERDELVDIQVINALGQPVKSLSLNPTETFRAEVDLSGMPAGMYSVHFQKADGETHVERVVLSANE